VAKLFFMPGDGKIHLPYLLMALGKARFEGRLKLLEGKVERVVMFRAGAPVNVLSNLQEETLGRLLVEEGRIGEEQYRRLLDHMVKTGQRAGEALVALGFVTPQEVYASLELQCRRKLRHCFRMADFSFEVHKEAIPVESVLATMDISSEILAGIEECYSVDRLLGEFPVDEETVFKRRAQPAAGGLRLGPAEQRLLNRIGSGNSLIKLQAQEKDLRLLLARLYALHALDLIEATGVSWPPLEDLELGVEAPRSSTGEVKALPEVEIDLEEEEKPLTLKNVLQAASIDEKLAGKLLTADRDDYFKLLEIEPTGDARQVQQAYRDVVQRFGLDKIAEHYQSPSSRQAAQLLLKRLNAALAALRNDQACREYMQQLVGRPAPAAPSPRLLADVEAQKGEQALAARNYAQAMECFDRAIGIYPGEPGYHFKLGLAGYFDALDKTAADSPLPDRVRKPLLKVLALSPGHSEARLYLAYISKRNGELERALKEFKIVLQFDPQNERAQREIKQLERQMAARKDKRK
jgi:tetratricopeptide (TPR) repeat protein